MISVKGALELPLLKGRTPWGQPRECIIIDETPPPPPPPPPPKKNKTTRTRKATLEEQTRKEAWIVHYGSNHKSAVCMFCGISEIRFNVTAGWQAGHVIAEGMCSDPKLYLYLVPICNGCNRNMDQQNAIDYLYDNFRLDDLRTLCTNMYTAWQGRPGNDIVTHDGCLYKFVKHVYGSCEGGISKENAEGIYKTLMLHQMKLVEAEIAEHVKIIQDKTMLVGRLVSSAFRPMKRARLFE